ncbi:hypothetical protein L915_06866, partial [Phytophthora nicotianae]
SGGHPSTHFSMQYYIVHECKKRELLHKRNCFFAGTCGNTLGQSTYLSICKSCNIGMRGLITSVATSKDKVI